MSLSHEQILALLEAAGLTRPAAEEAAARVAVELERGERGAAGERGERDERGERGAAGERGERDERGERGEHAEHDEHDDTGEYGDTGEEARLGSPPGTEETLQQHGFPSGPGAGGAGDGTGAGDGDGASAGDWPGPGARKPGDGKGRKIGLLRPGERVDQYEVIRSLGAGGMGEVFLARDALLGRLAALKVVHPHLLSAAGSVERFLFEARATARFSHPSIVTIYGLGQVRGSPYIALEYLQGSTLRDRLKGGPLPLGETVETARRVAAALEEAHRQGVLHCDLKPENVFLPRDGRLRVLDFGLARLVEEKRLPVAPGSEQASEDGAGTKAAAPISVTATGSGSASGTAPGSTPVSVSASSLPPDLSPRPETTLRGTTSYMAPEQWQKMPLGPATDLWAFGVVLFEMLAGRRPFLGSPVAIYERVSAPDAAKRAAKALPPHLPAELRSLCLQCLARDPRERPTAQEAAARLRALSPERAGRARDAEESPFRGLLPFRRDHADLFFGRDPEIAAFVERLRGSPLLAVLGPSGAGKSSFVQAGVIPRLHSLGAWDCLVVRPGTAPLHTLAARLERGQDEQSESAPASPARDSPEDGDGSPEGGGSARLPSETTLEARRDLAARLGEEPGLLGKLLRERAAQAGGRVLLVVDQLEEVFTLTRDPAERESLCRALLFAADDPEGPVRLVLTIREDFLGRLALFPDLIAEVSRGIFVMRTLGPEALAETLREPVLRRGYRFEDDSLVTDMTAEVASEPSGLPLLQFAATRLWEGRDRERRLLLRSTYEAIGGVEGALAAHADHALQGLVGAASGAAKELLLRLVTPEGTRAARKEEDLVAEAGPGGREALDHLVAARLLVSRRGVSGAKPVTELELVHESLLHRWDRLRRWLEESREDVRLRAELEGAVGQWRRRGGRDDDLWRGRSLAEALDWRERQSAPLHPATDDFLRASEALARRSAVRRTQVKAVAAALALLLAVGVGALLRVRQGELRARQAWAAAEKARRDARSRLAAALLEGAQTARLRGHLAEARAKLRASFEVSDSVGARGLFESLKRDPLRFRARHPDSVLSVAMAPDGRSLATGSYDGSIRLWDWGTGAVRVLRGHRKEVYDLAFDPRGRYLLSGAGDGDVRLWSLPSGRSQVIVSHLDRVFAVAFDPEGGHLASASGDGIIKTWRLGEGQPKLLNGHRGRVTDLQLTSGGERLPSGGDDGTVRLWQVKEGSHSVLGEHQGPVTAVSLAERSQRAASAGEDGGLRVFGLDGAASKTLHGHAGAVTALAFDPSADRLATGGADRTLRMWELQTGTSRVLGAHEDRVTALSFGPDGKLLASSSEDRTALLWDPLVPPQPESSGHQGWVSGVAFHPEGEELASASQDRTVRLWNVSTGASRILRGHTARVIAVAYRPDGEELATGSFDRTVRLWDLRTGRSRTLRGHAARIYNIAYSPDGKRLVSASWDRTLRLWDLASGASRVLEGHTEPAFGVAFSPDGRRVASGSWDSTVRVWDLATGKSRILGKHQSRVSSVAWAPSGAFLASAGYDKTVVLWNPDTGARRVLRGHGDYLWGVAISPDSRTVATASRDRTIRLWDVATGKCSLVLEGHRMDANRVAFHPQGKLLASGSDDATVRLWELPSGRQRWRAPAMLGGEAPLLVTWRGLLGKEAFGEPSARPVQPRDPAQARLVLAIQKAAGPVSPTEDGLLVALVEAPGRVALWNAAEGRPLWSRAWPDVEALRALPGGVAALSRGVASFLPIEASEGSAPARLVDRGARRLIRLGPDLLVATREKAHLFDGRGQKKGSFAIDPGLSAALVTKELFIAGHRDGTLEVQPLGRPSERQAQRPYEDVPAVPVTALISGPMGTLGMGFRDGTAGLWNLSSGKLLEKRRLHGPVRQLRISGSRLLAATDLGDSASFDLSIFHRPACAILEELWSNFPATWERGQASHAPAPRDHACLSEDKPSKQ